MRFTGKWQRGGKLRRNLLATFSFLLPLFEVVGFLRPTSFSIVFRAQKGGKFNNAAQHTFTARGKMKKLAKTGTVPGLTEHQTLQGLKHGAADDCTYNDKCTMVSIVPCANWDYSGQVS